MNYYGGGACCPNQNASYFYPTYQGNRSNYAIVLVLFILLVIILGSRVNN